MGTFGKIAVGLATFLVVSYVGNKVVNGKRDAETSQIVDKIIKG